MTATISSQNADIFSQINTHITNLQMIINALEFLLRCKTELVEIFKDIDRVTEDEFINILHELRCQVEEQHRTYDNIFQQLPPLSHGKEDLEIAKEYFKDEISTHKGLIDLLTPDICENINKRVTTLARGIYLNKEYQKALRNHVSKISSREICGRGQIPSSIEEVIELSGSGLTQWSEDEVHVNLDIFFGSSIASGRLIEI